MNKRLYCLLIIAVLLFCITSKSMASGVKVQNHTNVSASLSANTNWGVRYTYAGYIDSYQLTFTNHSYSRNASYRIYIDGILRDSGSISLRVTVSPTTVNVTRKITGSTMEIHIRADGSVTIPLSGIIYEVGYASSQTSMDAVADRVEGISNEIGVINNRLMLMELMSVNISWDFGKTITRNSTEFINISFASEDVQYRYRVNNGSYTQWMDLTERIEVQLGSTAGYKNVILQFRSSEEGAPIAKNISIWKLLI